MRVRELKRGQYCTRDNWGNRNSKGLCIGRNDNFELEYHDNGRRSSIVRKDSTAYDYNDFRLCDRFGNDIKENNMKYADTNIVVSTNTGQLKGFNEEDEAIEWIEEELENSPRTKFMMFKPYQKIEPKRNTLKDLITAITS